MNEAGRRDSVPGCYGRARFTRALVPEAMLGCTFLFSSPGKLGSEGEGIAAEPRESRSRVWELCMFDSFQPLILPKDTFAWSDLTRNFVAFREGQIHF